MPNNGLARPAQVFAVVYMAVLFHGVLTVIIFRRCMSSLVSSKLPSSCHLRQEYFPLIGVASGTVYSSAVCVFTCKLYA